MRRIAACFVIAAVLCPAWGQARMRAGAFVEAGRGNLAASVPALSAVALQRAPVLYAASLSPTLAPAFPALAAPPETTSGEVKPAAARDGLGFEQVLAGGAAFFDGSANVPAPAIGESPGVPVSAPEDRRSSGLSPPTETEIEAAYRRARPHSEAVDTLGRAFAVTAAAAVTKYTFLGNYFLDMISREAPAFHRITADLIGAHDALDDALAQGFMRLLGRWYAFREHARQGTPVFESVVKHLPPSPIVNGEYWDMAAGMNAAVFIHRELDANTRYSFFDSSAFVASYLRSAAELAGAKNAAVVEGDIGTLAKPAKPLAVLRTKNAVYYVPGFDKKLEEMADWVAPGGRLVIQNDPNPGQRGFILEKHGPLIRGLITEGWELEYGFSGRPGKFSRYGLDTLILTRPKFAWKKTSEETARAWKAYADTVHHVDAGFTPDVPRAGRH